MVWHIIGARKRERERERERELMRRVPNKCSSLDSRMANIITFYNTFAAWSAVRYTFIHIYIFCRALYYLMRYDINIEKTWLCTHECNATYITYGTSEVTPISTLSRCICSAEKNMHILHFIHSCII